MIEAGESTTIELRIHKNGIILNEKTGHVIGKLLVDYDIIDKGIVPVQKDEQENSAQLVDRLDKLAECMMVPTDFTEQADFFILIAKVQKHIMDLDLEIKELKRLMKVPRIDDINEIQRLNKLLADIADIADKTLVDTFGLD